jgi:FHS family Na+ dependent glucose MFS transporter 1
METRSHPGNPYITTAIYYLGFICLGMATAVLGPTLQDLAGNTDSSLAQISSLFLVSSFGYLLGSFAAGRVFDRVKGHPILSLALLMVASILVVIPLIQKLLFLQVLFFIIGIAESHLDVGINTLIVWLHGNRVPPFMNGLHAFYGIGTTTAPLIVAAVISTTGSLNSIYWALSILFLPVAVLVLFSPSPSHIHSKQLAEERPAVSILVILITVIFFAFTGAELGFGGWIFTFTTSQVYGNPRLAASINAAFWAALTLGRVISIPLAVKFKPQKILWVDFCGIIVSLLVIIFFSSTAWLLWLGTIGTGLFMAPTFPSLLNDAQSRMHMSGKITSYFFVGASLGSMVIPWFMGQLIIPFGATAVMIVVLCSILVATGIFNILNIVQRNTFTTPPQPSSNGKGEV